MSVVQQQLMQIMLDMGRLHKTLAKQVTEENPEINLERKTTADDFLTFCDELTINPAKRDTFVSFIFENDMKIVIKINKTLYIGLRKIE